MFAVNAKLLVFISVLILTTSVTTISFRFPSRFQSSFLADQVLIFILVVTVGHKIIFSFPRLCIFRFLFGFPFSLLLQSFCNFLIPLFTSAQRAQMILRRWVFSLEDHDVPVDAFFTERIRQDICHFRYVMTKARDRDCYITQAYSMGITFLK